CRFRVQERAATGRSHTPPPLGVVVAFAPSRSTLVAPTTGCRALPARAQGGAARLRAASLDLRWPLTLILALVAIVEVPFRVAQWHAARGFHFGGMFWGVNDT